jgi:hypothetical protein
MLRTRPIVVLLLLALTGCQRLSPTERKLVGTWEYSGMDFTTRVAFRSDHTMATFFPDQDGRVWTPTSSGTWRMEGNDLLIEEQFLPNPLPLPGDTPRPKEAGRLTIREVTTDKIVWAESVGFQPYTRVK